VASGRIGDDPAGLRALRQWVQRGGKVWVLLDQVEPEAVAPLLGEAIDFQLVDRVGLTSFEIVSHRAGQRTVSSPLRLKRERPVTLARILLPSHEEVRHTVDGWPIWFTRSLGRGKVVFTTLGARGWYRPRERGQGPGERSDPPSPYENFPLLPVPLEPLGELGNVLALPPDGEGFRPDALAPLLNEEIGYSIVSRPSAAVVLAGFLLAMLVLGIALRRGGRLEWLGWLGPGLALASAGVFVVLGEVSRRAVPPTVAVGQIVEAGPDGREAAMRGLLAVYRPDSGTAPLAAEQGGFFEMDTAGLTGQTRRLVLTDIDEWHWENMDLPAGVRLASFRWNVPLQQPISAVARFGPEGIEGKLSAGPFEDLADALVVLPSSLQQRPPAAVAVRLAPDGALSAGPADVLPPGQYLAGTLLSDLQQRRQDLYREFMEDRETQREQRPPYLLAWARAIDLPFTLAPEPRQAGTALLVVPLQLQPPAPGSRITIPGPFCRCRRVLDNNHVAVAPDGNKGADMHLRFQLPPAVLPLRVERARLVARIEAPGRRVTVSAYDGNQLTLVHRVQSPLDPIRVDLADERWLRLDEEGGLHINLNLGEQAGGSSEKWTIHYLGLEVAGVRTNEPEKQP
jgi:hypothetical protein